jgi:uncharacterized protein involved in exopolysaccharide biosynthesis
MDVHVEQQAASVGRAATPSGVSAAWDAPQGAPASNSLISPREILSTLWRNSVPIGVCAVVGAVAAYAYAATLPKSYTAYGAIALEGERVAIPELQGVLRTDDAPDPMPFVRTEAQALGAHPLLVRLTRELHLDRNPEFNAALRPPNLLGTLVGDIKSVLPHSPSVSGAGTDDALVNALVHALAITQDNRSLVIGVSFTAYDPRLAAEAVNRLVADYISDRVKRRSSADKGANAEITHRIAQVSGEISSLEHQMQDIRTRSGVISLRAGSVSQQELEDLATEESKAAVERSEIAANLARAQAAAATGSADELASVIDSQTISRLREQESEASARVADLAARFGSNYPPLRSANADLAAVRRQLSGEAHRIVASLTSQLNVAQAREADVKAQLETARQAGAQAQDVTAKLEQLQQDVTTRRALYSSLLQSEQQTVAQPRADALPDVRVLSNADIPGLPSAPNMKLSAGLGGIAGGLFAGLIAFARSTNTARFRGQADIEAATGAAVLAILPRGTGRARWDKLPETVKAAPSGPDASALRSALTRLRTGVGGGAARVVAFAGAQRRREAAAVAAAFARVAACGGQSVLLIDAASGGQFARVLGALPGAMDDVMGGARDWRDSLTHDPASPLDLLLGSGTSAATEEAGRVALENLLVEARDEYELIVLGAPSADEGPAAALARSADSTVRVVNTACAKPAGTRAAAVRLADMSRSRLGIIILGST